MRPSAIICTILLASVTVPDTAYALKTKTAQGAVLRALDTITGQVEDIEMKSGETVSYERLDITLTECRYPSGNINSNAYANLVIQDQRETEPRFEGWMIASSPALSALEHPRYDIWVLRCKTSDG